MRKVRITVMRKAEYPDLSAQYENPMEDACSMEEGEVFIAEDWNCKPEGLCDSAWTTLAPFVMALACGGTDIYPGWMKDPHTAMLSCNDGFRPVSFYLEALEEAVPHR